MLRSIPQCSQSWFWRQAAVVALAVTMVRGRGGRGVCFGMATCPRHPHCPSATCDVASQSSIPHLTPKKTPLKPHPKPCLVLVLVLRVPTGPDPALAVPKPHLRGSSSSFWHRGGGTSGTRGLRVVARDGMPGGAPRHSREEGNRAPASAAGFALDRSRRGEMKSEKGGTRSRRLGTLNPRQAGRQRGVRAGAALDAKPQGCEIARLAPAAAPIPLRDGGPDRKRAQDGSR